MAKARKILARKKAVNSIHTVTRTMEMVATARFKRAFGRCVSARGYINGCGELVMDILKRCDRDTLTHPLLHPKEMFRQRQLPRVVLGITSDRGLCGGYNEGVLKLLRSHMDELQQHGETVELHMAGKRGISQLEYEGQLVEFKHAVLVGSDKEWLTTAKLADLLMERFLGREIGGVDIVYSQLIGTARHEPTVLEMLPLELPELPKDEFERKMTMAERVEYEFVPDTDTVLKRLLPMTVRLKLFECFIEAAVTEQIARMAAMRSASESAEEMINNLNVKYNRTRQGQITTELAEILGGQLALE